MYFFLKKGKQHLDLKGDLILSHNDQLVKTRVKSAAPVGISSPDGFILNIGKLGFINKIRASWNIIKFVWTAKPLVQEDTNYRESYRANVKNSDKKTEGEHTCYLGGGKECRSTCPECTKKAI